jgi:hypothetical protein
VHTTIFSGLLQTGVTMYASKGFFIKVCRSVYLHEVLRALDTPSFLLGYSKTVFAKLDMLLS